MNPKSLVADKIGETREGFLFRPVEGTLVAGKLMGSLMEAGCT